MENPFTITFGKEPNKLISRLQRGADQERDNKYT